MHAAGFPSASGATFGAEPEPPWLAEDLVLTVNSSEEAALSSFPVEAHDPWADGDPWSNQQLKHAPSQSSMLS